ncbi:trehalose/maltose ABC transporter substrate-binding protein [Weizmannia acidilactici]|uniref:Trehalose/maltose ABC transporter substrate-binding protein n=1 Tax=Weizmannia acidilactici TaxID=2607726 RepID=A0A5J4JLA6_9BACI|nr:extracellular solute-binding protein [Weizmannia acidilactici]GER67129.1 trehalose/maltose ABC transporter substrate-binding protein [Weizmannia acidilactici]GER71410.1 trehalose/maltose ABC transporter substrate-binding protein [Weizmannia acidilactici]GER74754.1 trehalose/maltose ABC transporter substrate-binding protein [Weizmannia acidilactici]
MWKKTVSILAALTLIAGVLAGCGSSSTSKSNNNSGSSSKKIVLKFAAQNDNTPATKDVIAAFNKQSKKYKVEWVQMTNDSAQMHDQLLTSLSSGSSEYDILSMDVVWAGEFAGAGYLVPIDQKMMDANMTKDQFNAGSMASGNYEGKQYTLPFFPDLGILYYRSDIVSKDDAAKLESGNYTYKNLGEMAAKYAGKGGTTNGFVYQSKQYEGLTVNVTEFTDHYKDIKGGLQTMYNFTKAAWAPKDLLNYMESETVNSFVQGKSVFARNWPYQYGTVKAGGEGVKIKIQDVGIAPLPNGGAVGGWLLGINKNSKHIEGAWEFMKFVAGKEGQKIMSTKGGYLPGYNALLNDPAVQKENKMLTMPGFQKALKTTIARPVSAKYNKVSDTIQIAAHKYLSTGKNLDDAAKTIQDAVGKK